MSTSSILPYVGAQSTFFERAPDRKPAMLPGRAVMTQFNTRTTFHTIVERRDDTRSQSGAMVKVEPALSHDASNPYHDGFVDVGWFDLADEQLVLPL